MIKYTFYIYPEKKVIPIYNFQFSGKYKTHWTMSIIIWCCPFFSWWIRKHFNITLHWTWRVLNTYRPTNWGDRKLLNYYSITDFGNLHTGSEDLCWLLNIQGRVNTIASPDTGEAKCILLLLGIKFQFLSDLACSLVILPSMVSLLPELRGSYIYYLTRRLKLCIRLTSLASITVPTPTVKACLGTFDMSFPKKRALASRVSWANVFTLVLDTRDDPGSLKAMCPSGPIPNE